MTTEINRYLFHLNFNKVSIEKHFKADIFVLYIINTPWKKSSVRVKKAVGGVYGFYSLK